MRYFVMNKNIKKVTLHALLSYKVMKKKLEAELISIAHRILKLKNRAELEQLQQETLNLYQKLSVLKFVEDNFNDVKPTIGFASAEQKLEEIYSRETQTTTVEQQESAEDKENTTPETNEENIVPAVAENVTPQEESPEEIDATGNEPIAEETPVATEEPAAVAEETQEPEKITQTEAPEYLEQPAESEPSQETAAETEETTAETEEVQATETESTEVTEESVVESDETTTAENVETSTENPQETEQEKDQEEQQEHQDQPEEHKKLAEQPLTHHREEITAEVGLHEDLQEPITEVPELPETGQLPEDNAEDTENGTGEGIDIPTGEPAVSQEEAIITEETTGTEINFDRKEPAKQREIVFEDFSKFIEPEFVKKTSGTEKTTEVPITPVEQAAPSFDDWMNWEPKKEEATPVAELPKEEPKPVNPLDDWMNWEPSKSPYAAETTKEETTKEEPKAEAKTEPTTDDWMNWEPSKSAYGSTPTEPEAPKAAPVNEWRAPDPELFTQKSTEPEPVKPVAPKYSDTFVRAMSLGLNDRIAFEKHLFGGSSEDLNRVVSQINTLNTYEEAHDFITDLVKPDYNNWNGKDEYEARFMELVEKKFR